MSAMSSSRSALLALCPPHDPLHRSMQRVVRNVVRNDPDDLPPKPRLPPKPSTKTVAFPPKPLVGKQRFWTCSDCLWTCSDCSYLLAFGLVRIAHDFYFGPGPTKSTICQYSTSVGDTTRSSTSRRPRPGGRGPLNGAPVK